MEKTLGLVNLGVTELKSSLVLPGVLIGLLLLYQIARNMRQGQTGTETGQ